MPRRPSVPEQDVNSSRPKCCHHQPSKEIDLPAHKNHLLPGYWERITGVILTPAVGGKWNNYESQKSCPYAFISTRCPTVGRSRLPQGAGAPGRRLRTAAAMLRSSMTESISSHTLQRMCLVCRFSFSVSPGARSRPCLRLLSRRTCGLAFQFLLTDDGYYLPRSIRKAATWCWWRISGEPRGRAPLTTKCVRFGTTMMPRLS